MCKLCTEYMQRIMCKEYMLKEDNISSFFMEMGVQYVKRNKNNFNAVVIEYLRNMAGKYEERGSKMNRC